MKIGIIGAGRMGSALAKLWIKKHSLKITSADLKDAEMLASTLGNNSSTGSVKEIADWSDIILLAVPYSAIGDVASVYSDWSGKAILEIINPLASDLLSLEVGFTTSAAEEVGKAFDKANVVAAFHTIPSPVLENEKQDFDGMKASVFYCGNDTKSKSLVGELIEDAGFEAVDSGELKNARYLEPMAELIIQLAFSGLGADISLKLLKR